MSETLASSNLKQGNQLKTGQSLKAVEKAKKLVRLLQKVRKPFWTQKSWKQKINLPEPSETSRCKIFLGLLSRNEKRTVRPYLQKIYRNIVDCRLQTTNQKDPFVPNSVPAGENQTIGTFCNLKNNCQKSSELKQAVTRFKSTQIKCKIMKILC